MALRHILFLSATLIGISPSVTAQSRPEDGQLFSCYTNVPYLCDVGGLDQDVCCSSFTPEDGRGLFTGVNCTGALTGSGSSSRYCLGPTTVPILAGCCLEHRRTNGTGGGTGINCVPKPHADVPLQK
ncbi:hypothetical protein F4779DRAFT_603982 [Xylariaceae sp. FL0662B]|nr:hypothetical protein F4779DRAFT_603982 [Xylariaceae sp. FL0662B]